MKVSVLMLMALFLLPQLSTAQEVVPTLTVQVVTPDGNPKQGIMVTAEGPNFKETAVTNSSGFAVLRQLPPGTYDLVASLQNIELIRQSISFPETTYLVLEVPLSRLVLRVVDLAGRGVGDIFVTLTSPSGVISKSQMTNRTGYAIFSDIPYSSVASVGGVYEVRVTKQGIEVGRGAVEVEEPSIVFEVKASLVDVVFTVVNLEGQAVSLDSTLSLQATNYTETISVTGGKASVKQLPSSSIVGPYNASLSVQLGPRTVTVFKSLLSLDVDANISLPAGVGELTLKVVDPDGFPVKGIGVLVGAVGSGNFTSGVSGDDGTFSAGLLPLSTHVGEYIVSLFKGRKRIGVERISLEVSKAVIELRINFQRLTVKVSDYDGRPLDGAQVIFADPQTGRQANTTTVKGIGLISVLPGTNQLAISYKGKEVYRSLVEVAGDEVAIRLQSVNFPVVIRFLDSFGRSVGGLRFSVMVDGVERASGLTGDTPLTVVLELPAEVMVDVYKGGSLLTRERVLANGPSNIDIRFNDLVAFGEVLISLQTLVSALLAVIFAVLVTVMAYRLRLSRQR